MTPVEMAALALQSIESGSRMSMQIPRGKMPRTFPRGELLNEMRRDGVVMRLYSFDPERILEWLIENDLVEIKQEGDEMVISEKAPAP